MTKEISIIIPTYNRKKMLEKCLFSIFNQSFDQEKMEVIVVDDGSSDGTSKVMRGFMAKHENLVYLKQHSKGPAAARNKAISVAKGKIIGMVDDDCTVEKNWVEKMLRAHIQAPGIEAIGGATQVNTKSVPVMVSQFLSNSSIETIIERKKEVVFFPTCNVSFKREILEKNKFNERFPLPGGEDLEFFWRLFKAGHRFALEKNIKLVHFRQESLLTFIKQAYIYGRGNLLVKHLHPDQPLLKELKTKGGQFWLASAINILKIPRFAFVLGAKQIDSCGEVLLMRKVKIYLSFILHKMFYIFGNVKEFFCLNKTEEKQRPLTEHVPELLIIDITHRCNLSCRICDIWQTQKSEKDMPIEEVKKLIFQAKELGIREIAFSGGEPLLREDIFELLEYAKGQGIKRLGVLSNGILIEKHFERLKPYLLNNTVSPVVSFDSLTPEIHNNIRNSKEAWQKTQEALKKLSFLKKDNPQVDFGVIAIILNNNLEEMVPLVDYVKKLDAGFLQFQALLPNNLNMAERKDEVFSVTEERQGVLDKVVDELVERKGKDPVFIKNSIKTLELIKKYYRGTIENSDIKCLSAEKTWLVSSRGEFRTCFGCYGNIKKDSLKSVLTGDRIVMAREGVKKCSWPCLLPCFCNTKK